MALVGGLADSEWLKMIPQWYIVKADDGDLLKPKT